MKIKILTITLALLFALTTICFADLLTDDFGWRGEVGAGINKALGNGLSLQATAGVDMDLEEFNNFLDGDDNDGLVKGAVVRVYLIKTFE